ncbi:tetratricopeptide repeat protein [Pontibacillus salicampi]|uniref:Tetratricopeptide repeat protein n=1 Tax=Pontibacillus salicampi TaxID=1449801 RepID=A0ABV6LJE0_9BACI
MSNEKGDVVLFPKWKSTLESEGLAALKSKKYEQAIQSFDTLIEFDAASSEVLTGKLVSLMELGRYKEAESLCRELMHREDDHYFQYLHIYLTVLFQTGQYDELLELLDEVFESTDIPHDIRQQFWQLYEITDKLKVDEAQSEQAENLDELVLALQTEDTKLQWQLISKLKKVDVKPYVDQLVPFLELEKVQPVIKTALLQWMQVSGVERKVQIQKLGNTTVVTPNDLPDVLSHPASIHILHLLNEVEQNNPTLFDFIQQLLFRYMYVRFPIVPEDEELPYIAKALFELSKTYMQLENEKFPMQMALPEEEVNVWKQQIEYYELHYFSVLDSN